MAMVVQHPKDPPPFMRDLHFEAMHTPKFLEYANMTNSYVADGELYVGVQFSNLKAIV